MKKMKKMIRVFLSVLIFASCFSAVQGADAKTLKKNMKERLTKIADLKKRGIVGEDNKGYLAPVEQTLNEADAALVKAENADRKTIYTAIGKQQGASAEDVGKRRAIRLSNLAFPGTYVMDETGKWVKKEKN